MVQNEFSTCKAEEGGAAMAAMADGTVCRRHTFCTASETECRPTPQMEIQTSHSLNYDGVRLVAADNSFPDLNGIVAGITTLGIVKILI